MGARSEIITNGVDHFHTVLQRPLRQHALSSGRAGLGVAQQHAILFIQVTSRAEGIGDVVPERMEIVLPVGLDADGSEIVVKKRRRRAADVAAGVLQARSHMPRQSWPVTAAGKCHACSEHVRRRSICAVDHAACAPTQDYVAPRLYKVRT